MYVRSQKASHGYKTLTSIIVAWTWSATLLTSSTFAYSYGVCGPMWYGAMGTFQILLFALIAIKIKGRLSKFSSSNAVIQHSG